MPPGHVTFHGALGYVQAAWLRALTETCGDVLMPPDLGLVNVTADYRRELFDGPAVFDVTLERMGTSSLIFAADIIQSGELAARATLTFVRVDADRTRSLPLTAQQRAALAPLLTQ